jgi:hypothetical protein
MDRIGRRDLGKPERVAAATHARLDVQDQAADFAVWVGDVDQQHVPATREITQEV